MAKSKRAQYAEKKRKEDYTIKRFNDPLRVFIERRYPKVFNEFLEFYNFMNCANPRKKNLMKTLTFKECLKNNFMSIGNVIPSMNSSEATSKATSIPSSSSEATLIPFIPVPLMSSSEVLSSSSKSLSEATLIPSSSSEATLIPVPLMSSSEVTSSSSTPILEEMLSVNSNEIPSTSSGETRPSEAIILNEIIEEVFGPGGIPEEDIFNEDEGIELNRLDELAFDYEPFDFLAETEGF